MKNFTAKLALTIPLLFTACTTTTVLKEPLKEKAAPRITKTIIEEKSTIPNISGTYNLVEGSFIYKNGSLALKNKIQDSSIVIEKLDENDFGFYYVTKVEGLHTEGYFGGFTYKDGQFYQKVIDYPTTNTTLRDNINLSSTKDSLNLTVNTINATRVIHWEKQANDTKPNSSIITALNEEKKAYVQLFKERLFPTRQHLSMK